MRTIRDFLCSSCGVVSEKLIDSDSHCIECPECHGDAVEQLSMPTVRLDGTSGDFPGAHDRWARIREDNARIKVRKGLLS